MLSKSIFLVFCLILALSVSWYLYQRATSNIKSYTYKQTPQGKLKLDVHFPDQWSADQQRPVVVFFFGGGWIEGSIKHFYHQADYLAKRGILAARVDYRVDSRHSTLPVDAVNDGRDAIRWLRNNANRLGIDPTRVVASGGSAGGHIAVATSIVDTDQEPGARPDLLILLNPVLDIIEPTFEMGFSKREQELVALMGESTALSISPNQHIDASTPETLLLIGGDDPLLAQAHDYVTRAQQANVQARLRIADNQGHGFFNTPHWRNATLIEIDEFLVSQGYLEGKHQIETASLEGVEMKAPAPQ